MPHDAAVLDSLRTKPGAITAGSLKYVRLADGSKYKGDLLDVWRHGRGTCIYAPSGDKYEGDWLYNARHGQGTFATADGGFTYTGLWRDDAAHGYEHPRCCCFAPHIHSLSTGTAVYQHIGTYVGEFANSQRSGWGTMTFADGSQFEGVWANDTLHKGCMTHVDGSTFVGDFINGARSYGTLTSSGSKWHGAFVDDVLHGPNGSCVVPGAYEYTGDWARGMRHGVGRCEYADGGVYEGAWADDLRHGQGTMTQPSGECYTGWFCQGRATGRGRLAFCDGSVYAGDVVDGRAHGKGELVDVDGVVTRGEWVEGAWQRGALCAALTRWRGDGLACAVAGRSASFEVQLRDERANPLAELDSVLRVCLQRDGERTVYALVRSVGGGWYRGHYVVTKAGAWAIAAEAEGVGLPLPFEYVVVLPAPAHARHSAVTVLPDRVEVVLCDEYDNVCDPSGEVVTVQVQAGGRVWYPVLDVVHGERMVGACVLQEELAVVDVLLEGARLRGCPVGVDRRVVQDSAVVEDMWQRWKDVLEEVEEHQHEDDTLPPAGVPVVTDLNDLWMLPRLQAQL